MATTVRELNKVPLDYQWRPITINRTGVTQPTYAINDVEWTPERMQHYLNLLGTVKCYSYDRDKSGYYINQQGTAQLYGNKFINHYWNNQHLKSQFFTRTEDPQGYSTNKERSEQTTTHPFTVSLLDIRVKYPYPYLTIDNEYQTKLPNGVTYTAFDLKWWIDNTEGVYDLLSQASRTVTDYRNNNHFTPKYSKGLVYHYNGDNRGHFAFDKIEQFKVGSPEWVEWVKQPLQVHYELNTGIPSFDLRNQVKGIYRLNLDKYGWAFNIHYLRGTNVRLDNNWKWLKDHQAPDGANPVVTEGEINVSFLPYESSVYVLDANNNRLYSNRIPYSTIKGKPWGTICSRELIEIADKNNPSRQVKEFHIHANDGHFFPTLRNFQQMRDTVEEPEYIPNTYPKLLKPWVFKNGYYQADAYIRDKLLRRVMIHMNYLDPVQMAHTVVPDRPFWYPLEDIETFTTPADEMKYGMHARRVTSTKVIQRENNRGTITLKANTVLLPLSIYPPDYRADCSLNNDGLEELCPPIGHDNMVQNSPEHYEQLGGTNAYLPIPYNEGYIENGVVHGDVMIAVILKVIPSNGSRTEAHNTTQFYKLPEGFQLTRLTHPTSGHLYWGIPNGSVDLTTFTRIVPALQEMFEWYRYIFPLRVYNDEGQPIIHDAEFSRLYFYPDKIESRLITQVDNVSFYWKNNMYPFRIIRYLDGNYWTVLFNPVRIDMLTHGYWYIGGDVMGNYIGLTGKWNRAGDSKLRDVSQTDEEVERFIKANEHANNRNYYQRYVGMLYSYDESFVTFKGRRFQVLKVVTP